MECDDESGKRANTKSMLRYMQLQIEMAIAQDLLNTMTTKCFQKCIRRPGTSLSNSEQRCIIKCMDRIMESYRLVSKPYGHRLERKGERK